MCEVRSGSSHLIYSAKRVRDSHFYRTQWNSWSCDCVISASFDWSRLCPFTFPTIWFKNIILPIVGVAAAVCSVVQHFIRREIAINLPLISIFLLFPCAVPAILFRTSNQLESDPFFFFFRLLYFYFWRYTHVRPSTDFSRSTFTTSFFFIIYLFNQDFPRRQRKRTYFTWFGRDLCRAKAAVVAETKKYCARGT